RFEPAKDGVGDVLGLEAGNQSAPTKRVRNVATCSCRLPWPPDAKQQQTLLLAISDKRDHATPGDPPESKLQQANHGHNQRGQTPSRTPANEFRMAKVAESRQRPRSAAR